MCKYIPRVGDIVKTKKGCRMSGNTKRAMIVIETDRFWRDYDACICFYNTEYSRYVKHIFLSKNLIKVA